MRLTFLKASLPFVFLTTLMAGQSATVAPTQKSAQQSAAKQSPTSSASAKNTHKARTHHHVARKRNATAAHHKQLKRAAYRPEYAEHSVEVINGASTQQVVFDEGKKAAGDGKDESPQMKVEVVNGTSSNTQYFYAGNGNGPESAPVSKRPVVVGVQSSDTRVVGGNRHPVVTGITAVGAGEAKSVNSGGPKVSTGVSPQPKRPEYQPETH